MTATLGINNPVHETMGITGLLKNTSQVNTFIKQILSFLTYGRTEAEMLANVGASSADFGGLCYLFPDDQDIQKKESHCLALFPQ
jgi:hypothetical protein